MHLAQISGTLWALLCYIWTCSCATTVSCKIVQIHKEVFQKFTKARLALSSLLKKYLRRLTSLTGIRGFDL